MRPLCYSDIRILKALLVVIGLQKVSKTKMNYHHFWWGLGGTEEGFALTIQQHQQFYSQLFPQKFVASDRGLKSLPDLDQLYPIITDLGPEAEVPICKRHKKSPSHI